MTADLISRARGGDGEAFRELIAPHEDELRLHCYRMLGSVRDAEDALQEVLLAAWQGLARFEGRASLRTWLYRVATTRCLNARRAASRRPLAAAPPGLTPLEPARLGAVTWLEPYPDVLLTGSTDAAAGPEALYESREAISLAFVTAVQLLPPRQRAVLLLRDVLGFPASESAAILGVSPQAVTSALKRARARLRESRAREPGPARERSRSSPRSPASASAAENALAERLTSAYQAGDVDAIVALFTEYAWLRMPPMPFEYQGRAPIRAFLAAVAFRDGRTYRLLRTRANGQLAFASYRHGTGTPHDFLVLALTGPVAAGYSEISVMTRFRPLPAPAGG